MSPFDEDVPVTHYIAPFYGAFDLTLGEDSAIYYEPRGMFYTLDRVERRRATVEIADAVDKHSVFDCKLRPFSITAFIMFMVCFRNLNIGSS